MSSRRKKRSSSPSPPPLEEEYQSYSSSVSSSSYSSSPYSDDSPHKERNIRNKHRRRNSSVSLSASHSSSSSENYNNQHGYDDHQPDHQSDSRSYSPVAKNPIKPKTSKTKKTKNGSRTTTTKKTNKRKLSPVVTPQPSNELSSTLSDTSTYSITPPGNPSSGLTTGSLFHRMNTADIKFRDEKAKVLRQYIVGKTIGEGSYGKVKEGIDSKTKRIVAIKIFDRKTLRKVIGGEAGVEREVNIIQDLNHKNIVRILSHFFIDSKHKLYIVFEYMGCGSLTSLLESAPGKKLCPYQARKIFTGLINGLEHLRQHRILHRDIKPDNLLLDSDGELKICDFGVAERLDTANKDKSEFGGIGSPAFQAPELIASPKLSSKKSKRTHDLLFKSDIWSAGIVLYIMIVGDYPFPNLGNIMLLFDDIVAGKYQIPSWVEPQCADLISKMMQTNPEKRIDLPQIKTHPWMTASLSKSGSIPFREIPSMWPDHSKSSLSSVVKKMSSLLKRCEEEERLSRFSFDVGRSSIDDSLPETTNPSSSKCNIM